MSRRAHGRARTERLGAIEARSPGFARSGLAVIFVLIALGFGAAPSRASDPLVVLLSPTPSQPAVGPVTVSFRVFSDGDPLRSAQVFVDGLGKATLRDFGQQPYAVQIDTGPDNLEHSIEVIVETVSGATGSARVETPAFRVDEQVDVRLQQIYVSVVRRGDAVLDLERSDFTVRDEGELSAIRLFERGNVPFTAAVLVDASTSMRGGKLEAAVRGASEFVSAVNPLDQVSLMLFSDQLQRSTPFTAVPSVIQFAVSGLEAAGGSAIHDALFVALRRLADKQGRKVIILLSDGVDVDSVLTATQIRELARRQSVVMYWLALERADVPPDATRVSPWRSAEEHAAERRELRRMVEELGGRTLSVDPDADLETVFREVLAELRNQYVLGIEPQGSGGAWRKLDVRVSRSGVEVRARDGYSAPP